jgi:nucleoside-diphosphate-sugar epimerase
LITGGAGFIGSALIARLIERYQIVVFDTLQRNALAKSGLADHPHLQIVQGDVLDLPALEGAMSGCSAVLHLAAVAGVDTVIRQPVRTMTTNLVGTLNVLSAAHRHGGIERLVAFSTSEVFGTHAYKVDELHATSQGGVGEARWTYAVSKLAGEHMAHAYFDEYNLPIVIVRPFNIYGPGQIGEGAIHHFVVRALRGDDLVVHGDGSQIRAWCYIDDLVDGTLMCLEAPSALGNTFNIGNPRSTVTIYDLAERIIRLANSPSRISFKPITYADIELRIPDISKMQTMLGYQARVNLDDGLSRTLAWYRQRHLDSVPDL